MKETELVERCRWEGNQIITVEEGNGKGGYGGGDDGVLTMRWVEVNPWPFLRRGKRCYLVASPAVNLPGLRRPLWRGERGREFSKL